MHNEVRKIIRLRNPLCRKAKMLNTDETWSKFRKIRNKCIKKVRLAKVNHEARVSALKANTNNIKTWWKLSKQALNIDRTTEPMPQLNYNNTSVESDQEKADVFKEFFYSTNCS